jgi:antitoxin component HigA of HigAB toxin-antitoxin module
MGTQADNLRDCAEKGRICHGEDKHFAKLNNDDVSLIRGLWDERGVTQYELAEMFGVTTNTINRIVNYRTWKRG